MQREKGKRGEREAAKELKRLFGVDARRGVQFSGGSDSPDVVHSIEGVHIEVKRAEALALEAAMSQAIGDAGSERLPVVLHRKNHKPWYAIVRLDDLPQLATQLYLTLANEDDESCETCGGEEEITCGVCAGTSISPTSNRPDDYGPHSSCTSCKHGVVPCPDCGDFE
jgi:hypothetical protein